MLNGLRIPADVNVPKKSRRNQFRPPADVKIPAAIGKYSSLKRYI